MRNLNDIQIKIKTKTTTHISQPKNEPQRSHMIQTPQIRIYKLPLLTQKPKEPPKQATTKAKQVQNSILNQLTDVKQHINASPKKYPLGFHSLTNILENIIGIPDPIYKIKEYINEINGVTSMITNIYPKI